MQLLVRAFEGKTLAVSMAEAETIEALKCKVASEECVSAESFQIAYMGHYLDESSTMTDCGLQQGTLHL